MRFCRFGDERFGLVEGSNVRDVTEALDVLQATLSSPISMQFWSGHAHWRRRPHLCL